LYGGHGAGKTLLLQSIIGTILPQAGTIKLFENTDYLQEKRRIGYVPQMPFTIGRMTTSDMLHYFSLSFGTLESNLVKILGLNVYEKKPAHKLPLSVQRNLNLGIALLGNPDFVLYDEPFDGLDAKECEKLLSTIALLNENRNITFLLTGQNYDLVSQIATKYGVLRNMQLLIELTPNELNEQCDRHIKIRTPQLLKAIPFLQDEFSEYEVLADDLVRVFCPLSYASALNKLLVTAGIEVSEIWISRMEQQEYLSKLAGGEITND